MPITLGNRVTEKDVRDWLDAEGFVGRNANIAGLDLHAIQRPGWLQVYRFHLRVKSRPMSDPDESGDVEESHWLERFGVVLDDERVRSRAMKTQIWIFEDEETQRLKLDSLSEGLLTCRSGQNVAWLWCVGVLITVLMLAGIVTSFFN